MKAMTSCRCGQLVVLLCSLHSITSAAAAAPVGELHSCYGVVCRFVRSLMAFVCQEIKGLLTYLLTYDISRSSFTFIFFKYLRTRQLCKELYRKYARLGQTGHEGVT